MSKKTVINNNYSEEAKKFVKVAIIVILIVGLVYLLTSFLLKNGNLNKKYTPAEVPEAVITYEEATIGMTFNRKDEIYYVAFDDFSDKNNVLLNSYILNYQSKENIKPIYKVNMSLEPNKNYKSEAENLNAQSVEELKIKTPTLIKVENNKNVKYINNINDIKSELTN